MISSVRYIRRGRALNDNNRSLTWINFKLTYTGKRSLNCRRRMEKSTINYILNIYICTLFYLLLSPEHWWFCYIEILLENYAEIVDRSSSSSSIFCIYSGWWFDYTEMSSFLIFTCSFILYKGCIESLIVYPLWQGIVFWYGKWDRIKVGLWI